MGCGYLFKCKECGASFEWTEGLGMMAFGASEDAKKEALEGLYGNTMKLFVKENPDVIIDGECVAYQCKKCNDLSQRQRMDAYLPNEGEEYPNYYDLKHSNRLIRKFVHKCQECGDDMREVKGYLKVCPCCGKKNDREETILNILWD